MIYRDRLYANYVSGNKQFERKLSASPQNQDHRNIINLRRAMKAWLKDIPKEGKELDVACGAGNMLQTLQVEGFTELYGVDISEEQVELAREQFPQVVCADLITYLKDYPNTFTLITAFDILEHFSKEEALSFLDNIYSALLPEGRLILQLPNGDSPFAGGIVHGDFTHEVTYTKISLSHVLLTCGFQPIEFQEHCPQPTSLKGRVRSILWSGLRQVIRFVHFIETGGPSSEIYTRVMRVIALKIDH